MIKLLPAVFILFTQMLMGQFNTPAIDGILGTDEYGTGNVNNYVSGSQTWYVTWDDANLYFFVSGAAVNDASVIYLDLNPIMPVNGSDGSNGTLIGHSYDGYTGTLPFRADAVIFVKASQREFRISDGSGGWGSATPDFGSITSGGTDREFSIPWSAIGGGRPASFNWLGVLVDGSGSYGAAPVLNPAGPSVFNPELSYYFTVSSTADGSSTNPVSRISYTHPGADIPELGDISLYDFTMNTASATITKSETGVWAINNDLNIYDGTINCGSSSGTITINNNLNIGASGHLNLNASTAALTVLGDFTNEGTLTLSSGPGGDIRLGGDYTDFGTINVEISNIWFIKNGTQTFTSSGNKEIPYLYIGEDMSTTTVQLSGLDKLVLSSPFGGAGLSFANENCILDLNNKDLEIGTESMEGSVLGSGKIKAGSESDITLLGTTGSGEDPNIGTLTFDPAGNTIRSFTINRTGTDSYITLGSSLTINNTLSLTSGYIVLGNNNLTFGSGAGIVNASSQSFIKTTGTGKVFHQYPSMLAKDYPVGDSSYYRPFSVNYSTSSETFTIGVRYVHPDNFSTALTPFISDAGFTLTTRSNYYWEFDGTNSSDLYNLLVTPNGAVGIGNFHLIRIIYSTDGTTFSTPGIHVNGSEAGFARADINGAVYNSGRFYLGGSAEFNNYLPVELTSFTARMTGTNVKLSWATASEIDNYGFEIERAIVTEGQDNTFSKIGFVQGNGTVYTPKEYTWIDNSVNKPGKYQYRLKQIDTDGDFEFSDAVEVIFGAPRAFELSQNYPNPFNPGTSIKYSTPVDAHVRITVFNALGEAVKVLQDGVKEAGYHSVTFDAAGLPSGMYYYRLEAGDFVQTRKMLLIK